MKNGVYLNLVKHVRQAFEESALVKIAARKGKDVFVEPNEEERGRSFGNNLMGYFSLSSI